jgi:hypothetical protein
MAKYRFVGTCSTIGEELVTRFGQVVELLSTDAENRVLHDNLALLPETTFSAIGFTEEELQKHPDVGLHSLAPAEFTAKRDAAWAAWHAWRQELANPSAAATAAKEGE